MDTVINQAGQGDFYQTLPPMRTPHAVFDQAGYAQAPADWLIAVSDIQGSTAAVQAGNHSDVNFAAAAMIAARIVAELKDRVGALPQPGRGEPVVVSLGGGADDALSALLHLGYGRAEAYAALARVQARLGGDLAVDVLVREGLRELTA